MLKKGSWLILSEVGGLEKVNEIPKTGNRSWKRLAREGIRVNCTFESSVAVYNGEADMVRWRDSKDEGFSKWLLRRAIQSTLVSVGVRWGTTGILKSF
ncbi:hypothetical protein LWI29_002385 [Acer saccharum]|uniref:Uncharacterized protein n=1 Tax=Acer saccharum TaxID=4024 RepID=A0AA39T911_ACESA|nr:hypothetical protein LWI29_002385 [Acer saccharum]